MGEALAVLLFGAAKLSAQTASEDGLLVAAPAPPLHRPASDSLLSSALRGPLLRSARPAPATAPPGLDGVFPSYFARPRVGFTYTRFYEVPGTVVSTSGFNGSVAYYVKPWVAAEGAIDAGVGKQLG